HYVGLPGYVEVSISQPQTVALISLFTQTAFVVGASAVAQVGSGGTYCVLALDTGNDTSVTISNGAAPTMNNCGLAANSAGSQAISVSGGARLTALAVAAVGTISITNGGSIVASGGYKSAQPAVTNPYAGTALPTPSGGTYNSVSLNHCNATVKGKPNPACPGGVQTLTPGLYNNGLTMGNDAVVTMTPGTYIIDGGTFTVGGDVKLTGTGVTIVLTGSGSKYATVNIGNGATVTLSAPTSGDMSGLLFFQDPDAPTSGTNNFQGGAVETLTGALYFPSQTVIYSNGTNSSSPCTEVVAWHIQFVGGSVFNSNCGTAGTKPVGGGPSVLVE
ncbi:MAG TPA: hypothetical protein VNF74_07865, partial [Terriglobales bacterium]|nr:hypothetical protein [Terriglobales bacterium]